MNTLILGKRNIKVIRIQNIFNKYMFREEKYNFYNER